MALQPIPTGWVHTWLTPLYLWLLNNVYAPLNDWLGTSWLPVVAMTTTALPDYDYDGTALTMTANANGAFPALDGVTLSQNARFYQNNGGDGSDNGLYVLTDPGSDSTPWIATRTDDANSSGEFTQGKQFLVQQGATLAGIYQLTNASFTLDTTTPTIALQSVVYTSGTQTITGLKTFVHLMLAVWNSGATFATKFTSLATATRTFTLPDADMTPAQATVATAGTAPAFTGAAPSAAMNQTINGATGTSTGGVTTLSAGGAIVAAHALAGGTAWDGTVESRIVDNTALTATTGTISTAQTLSATITATLVCYAPPTPVGAVASHTHTQT